MGAGGDDSPAKRARQGPPEGLGVLEDFLRYILTKKELADEACKWKNDLKLSGPKASEKEFKRSVGLMMGS